MEQFDPINQWLWLVVNLAKMLAWPLVVALAACLWRPSFAELFKSLSSRKMEVEALGAKVSLAAAEKQQTEVSNPGGALTPGSTPLPVAREALIPIERDIRAMIEAQAPNDIAQQNVLLVRAVAELRVQGSHEWVYNRIYGSQIAALRSLNSRESVTTADAVQFFESYVTRYPEHAGHFDLWLGFLLNNGLVERVAGDRLRITPLGRDFLIYITAAQLTDEKPW